MSTKETLKSTIENRLNDLGGWELVLLMPIPLRASLDALFTGYFKGSKILKPNTVGIAISRCVVSSKGRLVTALLFF
jgi:hypothetical protein